jgi:hypothetical protein
LTPPWVMVIAVITPPDTVADRAAPLASRSTA